MSINIFITIMTSIIQSIINIICSYYRYIIFKLKKYFYIRVGKCTHHKHSKPLIKLADQADIYKIAIDKKINNIVKKHLTLTCQDLILMDLGKEKFTCKNKDKWKQHAIFLKDKYFKCYGCSIFVKKLHPIYVFSCMKCGNKFWKYRNLTKDLSNYVCLVTGARTKLGHQVVLKLIKAGATVIATTRNPQKAFDIYKIYDDYDLWKHKLDIYPEPLDFDCSEIKLKLQKLYQYIEQKYSHLNILINCAAQTIRARDKMLFHTCSEENRYKDPKYVSTDTANSWTTELKDIVQSEMEEVYRVNAITPLLMVQTMIPLIQKSTVRPYIINVHAKEGLFNVHKSKYHIHLNMAKSSLSMLTTCLISAEYKTHNNIKISIHGCDPGWISVDEYYENNRPFIVPPIDEIDGAARVLFPIFTSLPSVKKTRRHYDILTY
jgi:NAD(P)-dependent dehydrogenase (short-subunit alcohol dehydrogenase family)